ncbi:MAG: hypothetical protein Kow00120_20510 [Anaerolineae bacterium]
MRVDHKRKVKPAKTRLSVARNLPCSNPAGLRTVPMALCQGTAPPARGQTAKVQDGGLNGQGA